MAKAAKWLTEGSAKEGGEAFAKGATLQDNPYMKRYHAAGKGLSIYDDPQIADSEQREAASLANDAGKWRDGWKHQWKLAGKPDRRATIRPQHPRAGTFTGRRGSGRM
jgi:hypothetical protein